MNEKMMNGDERTPLLITSKNACINDSSLADDRPGTPTSPLSQTTGASVYADPSEMPKYRRWLSIYILYFTMVTVTLTFSIVISSLFPYLQDVTSSHASTTLLGLVVAGYSVGQLISSPLLGYWSDRRPMREPIILALLLNTIANLAYCYAGALPSGGEYLVIAARVLVGACAGCAAVVRSYVAVATTQQERIRVLAWTSGFQSLGFTLGPLLALAFVPLKSSGWSIDAIKLKFNIYTGPAFLSSFLAVINIILILVFFKEYKLILPKKSTKPLKDASASPGLGRMSRFDRSKSASASVSVNIAIKDESPKPQVMPSVDHLATIVAIFLFFIILSMLSVFETITVPYTMDEFSWSRQQAVLYNNILFGALSVISLVTIIVIGYIGKYIQERIMMMFGFIVLAVSFFLLIPLSDSFPNVAISILNPSNTSTPVFHNESIPYALTNATIPVGCRYAELKWCIEVPQLLFPKYIASLCILGLGYNSAVISCFTIFSKILGPFPQGTMMGIITAVGSLSRAVGPLFVTYMYDMFGPQITFGTVDGILAVAIITLSVFCYRMVPYGQKRRL